MAVGRLGDGLPGEVPGLPPPHFELSDLSETTWDGVVVVWSTVFDEGKIRDRVPRSILAELPAVAAAR